ncbi:MAG: hypothetical protein NT018_05875 [Armatimonadetes bacterium]|nr:hypothetical protein [Armatimonadota bacterium]
MDEKEQPIIIGQATALRRAGKLEDAQALLDTAFVQCPSDASLLSYVLKYCRSTPSEVCRALRDFAAADGCPTPMLLAVLGRRLADFQPASDIAGLLKSISRDPASPGTEDFNHLVGAFGYAGFLETARDVLELMSRYSLKPDAETFNPLIAACGIARQPDLAWEFFEQMLRKSLRPNAHALDALIAVSGTAKTPSRAWDAFSRVIGWGTEPTRTTITQLFNVLGSSVVAAHTTEILKIVSGFPLPTRLLVGEVLIKQFMRVKHTGRALEVLRQMIDQGLHPSATIYHSLLDAHAHNGKPHRIWETFNLMIAEGIQPDAEVFETMITSLGRGGLANEAWDAFQAMRRSGLKPSATAFAALVDGYGRVGQPERAWDVVQTMRDAKFELNCQVSNSLIAAFGRSGLWERAWHVLEMMRECDLKPTKDTYNLLLAALAAERRHSQALAVFHMMQEDGIGADLATFDALTLSFADHGIPEVVWDSFASVDASRDLRHPGKYQGVFRAFVAARGEKESREVIRAMQQSSPLSLESLAGFAIGFLENGYVDTAWQITSEMLRMDSEIHFITMNHLARIFIQYGESEYAWQIFSVARQRNVSLAQATLNRLVQMLLILHETAKVTDTLRWMLQRQIGLSVETLALLISENYDEGELHLSQMIARIGGKHMEEIVSNAIAFIESDTPEHALRIFRMAAGSSGGRIWQCADLVAALGRSGQVELAWQFLRCARDTNTTPKPYHCMLLIRAFGDTGHPNEAWNVFEFARQCGAEVDAYAFSALINAFGDAGLADRAREAFHLMLENGIGADNYSCSALIRAYGIAEEPDGALRVFATMKQDGIPADEYTYTALVKTLGRAGRLEEAWEAYSDMPASLTQPEGYTYKALRSSFRRDADRSCDAICAIVRSSDDVELLRFTSRVLGEARSFPNEVVDAVFEKLSQPLIGISLAQSVARILSGLLATNYFHGQSGTDDFAALAQRTVRVALAQDAQIGQEILFQLLVGEGAAILKALIRSYADEALAIFEPILGNYDEARAALRDHQLLSDINTFLRAELPVSVLPAYYSFGDSCDLHLLISKLANEARYTLCEDPEEYDTKVILDHCGTDETSVPLTCWLLVRPLLRQLLNMEKGPLEPLWQNTADWSVRISSQCGRIELTISFEQIDTSHRPSEIIATARRELNTRTFPYGCQAQFTFLDNEPPGVFGVSLVLRMPTGSALPSSLAGLSPLFDYVAGERRRWLTEGTPDPAYYWNAHELFREGIAPLFATTEPEAWVRGLALGLDRQFAAVVAWLLTSHETVRAPRIAVHDLKKKIQAASNSLATGMELADSEIAQIQRAALDVYVAIAKTVNLEIYEDEADEVDLVCAVKAAVDEWSGYTTGVKFIVSSRKPVSALIHPSLLRSALLNLIHNAVEAVKLTHFGCSIRFAVSEDTERQMGVVSIANPYDPQAAPSADSSTIGLVGIRHIIEDIAGGTVSVTADETQEVWSVQLKLPLQTLGGQPVERE